MQCLLPLPCSSARSVHSQALGPQQEGQGQQVQVWHVCARARPLAHTHTHTHKAHTHIIIIIIIDLSAHYGVRTCERHAYMHIQSY